MPYGNRQNSNSRNHPLPTEPPFKVFVGSLPPATIQSDIEEIFADCSVSHVRLIYDRESNQFKGFGYVELADLEGLKSALEFDGAVLEGRPIRVNVADQNDRKRDGGGRGGRGGRGGGGERAGGNRGRDSGSRGGGGGFQDRNPRGGDNGFDRQQSSGSNDYSNFNNRSYNRQNSSRGGGGGGSDRGWGGDRSSRQHSTSSYDAAPVFNEDPVSTGRKPLNLKKRSTPQDGGGSQSNDSGARSSSIFGTGKAREESK